MVPCAPAATLIASFSAAMSTNGCFTGLLMSSGMGIFFSPGNQPLVSFPNPGKDQAIPFKQ